MKTLYTLGFISETSLLLDDSVITSHLDLAEREGKVASHTAPLVILGNAGAGKTSLSLTLRDKELPASEGPPKTVGLQETLIEVSFVDRSWRELNQRFLEALSRTEFVRARMFCLAAIMKKYKEKLKGRFSNGQVKLLLMLLFIVYPFVISLLFSKKQMHLGVQMLIFCGFFALINQSHNVHFIMGYGSAIVIEIIRFGSAQNYALNDDIYRTARVLATVTFVTFFTTLFLGLGTGAGLMLCFCLFNPVVEEKADIDLFHLFFFILIGHLIPILKPRYRSILFHLKVVCVSFVMCFLVRQNTELFYCSTSFLIGYLIFFGIECGHNLAPKLSVGGNRNVFRTNAFGFTAGCFLVKGFGWNLTDHTPITIVFTIVTSAFSMYMLRSYHKNLKSQSHDVPLLQSLLDSSVSPKKPVRIALIDCAGDEVYHEAQHVYKTPFSVYIIVFRLIDIDTDNEDCDATFRNVSWWLNSVSAHAKASEARVYLVGTHKSTRADDINKRMNCLNELERRLKRHFSHMLVRVPEDDRLVFQIENRFRNYDDRDLQLLRKSIVENAQSKQVPLVWFHFLDIVREYKAHSNTLFPLPDLDQLYHLVKLRCELKDYDEFKEMLQYYNDCGEIFYDSYDAELSSRVLLDRSILVGVIRLLVPRPDGQHQPQFGFSRENLMQRLSHFVPRDCLDHLLDFLQALNFLVPTDRTNRFFWIPFNLPICESSGQLEADLEPLQCSAEFDFDTVHPSPLFLRLLSLCNHMQTANNNEVRGAGKG